MAVIVDFILKAIQDDDLGKVKSVLPGLGNIDDTVFYVKELDAMLTAFQVSIYFGCKDIADFLLSRGSALNAVTRETEHCCQLAARFLTFGFWCRSGSFTALHIASKYQINCIGFLLAKGANYKATDRRGNLPLTIAQLCNNFSVSPQLIELDTSIYGDFKQEYLSLVEAAIRTGNIKIVNIKFPPIHLVKGLQNINENLKTFLSLLALLRNNAHLTNITLDVQYIIKTSSGELSRSLLPCLSDAQLTHIRKAITRVLNSLLDLAKYGALQQVKLGEISHVHTEVRIETYSHYKYKADGKMELVTETKTIKTKKTTSLLKIDNTSIKKVVADPPAHAKKFQEISDDVMVNGNGLVMAMFSSSERLMTRKVLDPEIIVGFCARFYPLLKSDPEPIRLAELKCQAEEDSLAASLSSSESAMFTAYAADPASSVETQSESAPLAEMASLVTSSRSDTQSTLNKKLKVL